MHILLIFALAVLFPATHILNDWLFDFANINANISLIYMPAFLRLFNVLVLGPVFGTFATLLGGMLLIPHFDGPLNLTLMNIVCSSAGPIIALMSFKIYFKRSVQLTSLKDLATMTVIYCVFNSFLHHTTWLMLDIDKGLNISEMFWMLIGDLNGALLGAYLMKATIDFLESKGVKFPKSSPPKN